MEVKYTIEDIKRLVPEAKHVWDEKWLIGALEIAPSARLFDLLLTTRAQLEVALGALNEIAQWHDGPRVNSSFEEPGSARTSREAIAKIEEMK